jgi:hypothetical protein
VYYAVGGSKGALAHTYAAYTRDDEERITDVADLARGIVKRWLSIVLLRASHEIFIIEDVR